MLESSTGSLKRCRVAGVPPAPCPFSLHLCLSLLGALYCKLFEFPTTILQLLGTLGKGLFVAFLMNECMKGPSSLPFFSEKSECLWSFSRLATSISCEKTLKCLGGVSKIALYNATVSYIDYKFPPCIF